MACLIFLLFYLMPLVSQQAIELIQNLPRIINSVQTDIMRLPELYPTFISENKIQQMISVGQQELLTYAQNLLSISAATVVSIVSALIYLFLVPMMIFFFLKDKGKFSAWAVIAAIATAGAVFLPIGSRIIAAGVVPISISCSAIINR